MPHGALFMIGRNDRYFSKPGGNAGQRRNTRTVNSIIVGYQYSHREILNVEYRMLNAEVKYKIFELYLLRNSSVRYSTFDIKIVPGTIL